MPFAASDRPPAEQPDALRVEWPGRPALDLGRDTYALLGLVFDAVTMEQALAVLQRAAHDGRRCFLSTPNVNFVAMARHDAAFRRSVLHSDLSVADGMPIVWAARLLGLPIRERVAGADLFERLRQAGVPLKVYFFGGPDGVAERAAARLQADGGALRCVGFDSPGFQSVEAISGADRIARINASGADFLVVALGAKKGQAWIERNLDALRPMLVSHLGAVVNFVAGEVVRAPRLLARSGTEWLWRIAQEPALWRRYAGDGLALLGLCATQLLPQVLSTWWQRCSGAADPPADWDDGEADGSSLLRLRGAWTAARLGPLKALLARRLREGRTLQLDLSDVSRVDSAFVALLLRLDAWQQQPRLLVATQRLQPAVWRAFRRCGAEPPFATPTEGEPG